MTLTLICEAIRDQHIIEFDYYDSHGNSTHRVVEPYVYGRTSRRQDAIRGYQVGGTSQSDSSGTGIWRLFLCDRIRNLGRLEDTFAGTAPGYAHGDPALKPIYCRIP